VVDAQHARGGLTDPGPGTFAPSLTDDTPPVLTSRGAQQALEAAGMPASVVLPVSKAGVWQHDHEAGMVAPAVGSRSVALVIVRACRGSSRRGRGGPDVPDLIHDVRDTLRESHPLPLLAFVSSLLAVVDPRWTDPFGPPEAATVPSREELLGTFFEARGPETSALLAAVAELSDDELEQRWIQRELAGRPGKPPRWLQRLSPLRVRRAMEMSHVLGDGDNVMLDVVTGNGDPLTVLVYIDHNLGTLVKDAFVIDEPASALQPRFERMAADEPDTRFAELDLAEARARITEAIELAAITYPPLETETWPSCRPLVEWVLRHLPTGGTGYVRPDWPEADRDALVERFLGSPYAPDVPVEDARDLAHVMVWFACDYGPGDPLRWSTVSVEIFLGDFLAHKAVFPLDTLRRGPAVLAAFVRFAHAERGIRHELTAETLDGVERHTPVFLDQLDDDRPRIGHRLVGLLADHLPDEPGIGFTFDEDGRSIPIAKGMRSFLVEQVGGDETLDTLDIEPLRDEPLDLTAVPADVAERVAQIAALTDACCDELLDGEHRTACRRLLVDVAAGDPTIFRRRSRDDTAAAAIVWTIAKANGSLQAFQGGLTAKRLVGWFGITGSVSQRATPMLRAIGVPSRHHVGMQLGMPRYLVAEARAGIIERRDRYT